MTFTDAYSYILTQATSEELDRIFNALKDRRKVLGQVRAASVTTGARVELVGLRPAVLNGLTGVVSDFRPRGTRCDVTLDKESTQTLKFARTRFYVTGEAYTVKGVPLTCCKVAA